MQTRRTQGRQKSRGVALPLFICLRGRKEGYTELTRILRPTKTPTQKFAWNRGRFTRAHLHPRWERASVSLDEDRFRAA